jgi:hypothetical protein
MTGCLRLARGQYRAWLNGTAQSMEATSMHGFATDLELDIRNLLLRPESEFRARLASRYPTMGQSDMDKIRAGNWHVKGAPFSERQELMVGDPIDRARDEYRAARASEPSRIILAR